MSNFNLSQLPIMEIAFGLMTLCVIGGALGVVTSQKLFHSALYLILSLFGVAGYYVLLSAGFLAMVQLMVYIGAVAILLLFAVMFSRQVMGEDTCQTNPQPWINVIIALGLLLALLAAIYAVEWPLSSTQPGSDTVEQLGLAFLGDYLLLFEVVGVLLSMALIGAVILAREKTKAEETE
jgi:NADH:ubiquinone oxidoreductase subunit 6 (subunit J)